MHYENDIRITAEGIGELKIRQGIKTKAIVKMEAESLELIRCYRWRLHGPYRYVVTGQGPKTQMLHNLIMGGPTKLLDKNPQNCLRSNLKLRE
jgi:hypothetical protein